MSTLLITFSLYLIFSILISVAIKFSFNDGFFMLLDFAAILVFCVKIYQLNRQVGWDLMLCFVLAFVCFFILFAGMITIIIKVNKLLKVGDVSETASSAPQGASVD